MTIVLGRGPRTDDELYELVKALWGHTIPRHKVCPEHNAPFEAFAHGYFNRDPQILIKGSRGLSGKSRLVSLLGLTYAAVQGADTNIVGGSLNQSLNIQETIRDAFNYENAPRYMIRDESQTAVRLVNNAVIRPLTASQKTVRGPHPPMLLLDEIDEMDPDILESAKGQPMPQKNWRGDIIPAQTIMSSTLQYSDKAMAQELARFETEELPIFEWCYRDTSNPIDGWLDPKFVEQKRREVSNERWRVEYDLGEPSIGNRAIDAGAVEQMFSLPTDTLKVKEGKEWQEYRFEDPKLDREYVIGADWAQAVDWTVISVVDVTYFPVKVVHWVRMRRHPYPVMVGVFNKLMKAYNAEGIHDATGLGAVVADYIDRRARGFIMAGRARDDMLSEYVSSIENGKWLAPRIREFYLSHLYCSTEQLFNRGKEFHLPDEVCSMALVWRSISKRAIPAHPIVVAGGNDPTWIESEMANNHDAKRKPGKWVVGSVENKSQQTMEELDLMV
jgi:hypothetical protein